MNRIYKRNTPKYIFVSFIFFIITSVSLSQAEVLRDGSLGSDITDQPTGPDFLISEPMGSRVGSNLFHSFDTFDLSDAESATFSGSDGIDNIISRVTGGEISTINGDVTSNVAGANLFFINPSGIVVGENGSIDAEGSVHLSTANTLLFDSGERFESRFNGTVPLLTSALPQAFGFSGESNAAIRINGNTLEFDNVQNFSVTAGSITIGDEAAAEISSEGGRLVFVAVGGSGEVSLGQNFNASPESIITSGFSQWGPITISGGSALSADGDASGSITMIGSTLTVEDAELSVDNTGGRDAGIAIRLDFSESISLSGETELASNSEGNGRGGSVQITSPRLSLSDESEVIADALAGGGGGNITIITENLTLSGDSEIATDTEDSGQGGNISITSNDFTMLDESEISSDTNEGSSGMGGQVLLTISGQAELRLRTEPGEEAGLFTNSEGTGNAGTLTVSSESLLLDGAVITASTSETGQGGDVIINTQSLHLENSAKISANSTGAGLAGNITINSGNINLMSNSRITTSAPFSNGGNITVTAQGNLHTQNATISANVNDGVGGNLTLSAHGMILDNSKIVAQAGKGQGGAINVAAKFLFNQQSLVSASAGPEGISGTVEINAPEVDLSAALLPLSDAFINAVDLIAPLCSARENGEGENQESMLTALQHFSPSTIEGFPLKISHSDNPTPEAPSDAEDAIVFYRKSAETFKERAELAKSGRAYSNAARASIVVDMDQALVLLEQAQNIVGNLAANSDKMYTLIHIGNTYARIYEHLQSHPNPARQAAILLQAHSAIQAANIIAAALGDERGKAFSSGNLAKLYQHEGRSREALYLTRRAQTAAEAAHALESQYRWHWLEGELHWEQGHSTEAVSALRRAVALLESTRQETLLQNESGDLFFKQEMTPVYQKLIDILLQTSSLIDHPNEAQRLFHLARNIAEQFKAAELRNYFHDPCIKALAAKSRAIDTLSQDAAVVYPILLEDRLELLVSISQQMKRYTVDVERSELIKKANRFRSFVQRPFSNKYKDLGKGLYRWLLEPYRQDLEDAQIKTLVFVPDGLLRSIPFAALHDGQQFLIENFGIAVTPGLDLIDPHSLNSTEIKPLLLGVSQAVQGFSELPAVPQELQTIQSTLGGQVLLNDQFSLENLSTALREEKPSLLHIASHASFGAESGQSFLLTYDTKLSIDAFGKMLRTIRYSEQPLEMIVLSACETAVGDEKAALGLAGVALRAGARSAVGSLWRVSDDASLALMGDFYDALAQGASKVDALRQAQSRLLEQSRFHHPYYWSSFLLISNWL